MKRLIFAAVLLFFTRPVNADGSLLGSPQVRKELGIAHPLAVRIVHNLNEAARLNRGGVMSAEEYRQLQAEQKRTPPEVFENQVMDWLSPTQKRRLEQIELQRGSPFIFEDWRFARRVGLSRQQHRRLQPIFDKAARRSFKEQDRLFKSNLSWYGRVDRKRYAAKYVAYEREFERIGNRRKTTVEAALARSLTPTQKAKWQTLLGKPFRAHLTYDTKSYPMD